MKAEEQSRERMCGERGRGMRTQLQEMKAVFCAYCLDASLQDAAKASTRANESAAPDSETSPPFTGRIEERVPIQRAPGARDYQVSGSRRDPPAKDGARQTLSLLFLLPTVFTPHVS